MTGSYVIGWRFTMGLIRGAVVGGLGAPALLAPLDGSEQAIALAMLLSALLGGVIETISERQHGQQARRLARLLTPREELPDG